MEKRIKSVQKGWGEDSIFFFVVPRVLDTRRCTEIKEETKQVGNDILINVFRGYNHGELYFEMGASIDVTVVYF